MLGLLGRMYSCHVVTDRQIDNLLHIPGLLLIDEAENHLHPKWQKRFISTVQRIFPNLQIVVATHSPFIVASVKGARVFVCTTDGKRCTVEDVSSTYADRPIDEILLSPAFAETQPFSQEITDLLAQRKAAIEAGDDAARQRIEAELLDRNPEYFDYFHLDTLLGKVAGGASS
jgi:predicted ATP-binding protein involved in virulence